MVKGGHAWRRGVCMVKGGMCGMHTPLYEIRPVNARAVRILLECILVSWKYSQVKENNRQISI